VVTPSFLATPAEKEQRAGNRARVKSKVTAADFEDISISNTSPHSFQKQRESGAGNQNRTERNNSTLKETGTPSFLASPTEKAQRAGNKARVKSSKVTAADFEDISVGEDIGQYPYSSAEKSNKRAAVKNTSNTANSSAISAIVVTTPSFLASPEEGPARGGKKHTRRARVRVDPAAFEDITMTGTPEANQRESDQEKVRGGEVVEQGSSTQAATTTTPCFQASPAATAGRPSRWAAAAVWKARAAGGQAAAKVAEEEEGGSVPPSTPSFLKDSTLQKSAENSAAASGEKPRSDARNNRSGGAVNSPVGRMSNQELETAAGTDEMSVSLRRDTSGGGADKTPPPIQPTATKSGASPREEGEGNQAAISKEQQKWEETRAMRASRKSEALGYLVRY
jgi:hypothetical protein